MSGQDDSSEKSFEASQHKLDEARKRGELIRSADLNTAASYLGIILSLAFAAPLAANTFGLMGQALILDADGFAGRLLSTGGFTLSGQILWQVAFILILLLGVPALMAILSLVSQHAIVVAPEKLMPKLSRISLITNAGNKFGPTGLFEFLKSFVKLSIYGGLLFGFLFSKADQVLATLHAEPRQIVSLLSQLMIQFLMMVCLVAGVLGVIDYLWQRHTHLKKQMMTRKEMQDEAKSSDGDPHVKGQRRQRAQEIALNQMLADVPEATVIVVNPTHYAVALKWSATDPTPPICVAKGVDEVAARIRAVAAEYGVPIRRDPPTARAIHASVEVGHPIDRAQFAAVAAAIRFAEDMRQRAAHSW